MATKPRKAPKEANLPVPAPEPSERERAAMLAAHEKRKARPRPVRVKVESSEDKLVVNYREPATDLSDTAKILLAVGALVVLVLLFSLPVIGPLLAAILAVAVVAAALALILGYVEINRS